MDRRILTENKYSKRKGTNPDLQLLRLSAKKAAERDLLDKLKELDSEQLQLRALLAKCREESKLIRKNCDEFDKARNIASNATTTQSCFILRRAISTWTLLDSTLAMYSK